MEIWVTLKPLFINTRLECINIWYGASLWQWDSSL